MCSNSRRAVHSSMGIRWLDDEAALSLNDAVPDV